MARKQARIAAMQLIYEQMEGGDGGEETLRGLIGFGPAPAEEAPEEAVQTAEEVAAQSERDAEEEAAAAPDPDYAEDRVFIQSLVDGTVQNAAVLDEQIAAYLKDWTLERIARVDLAILRLSFYELLYLQDAPETVIISEAVEMAKRYSTDRSGAFVNGVLGALSRRDQA